MKIKYEALFICLYFLRKHGPFHMQMKSGNIDWFRCQHRTVLQFVMQKSGGTERWLATTFDAM